MRDRFTRLQRMVEDALSEPVASSSEESDIEDDDATSTLGRTEDDNSNLDTDAE